MNTTDHVSDLTDPCRDARNSAEQAPTPRTDAALQATVAQIEALWEERDKLEQRATRAEAELADANGLIKEVQRGWLGGEYGVMPFVEAVSTRITDALDSAEKADAEVERARVTIERLNGEIEVLKNGMAQNAALRAALEKITLYRAYNGDTWPADIASAALAKEGGR